MAKTGKIIRLTKSLNVEPLQMMVERHGDHRYYVFHLRAGDREIVTARHSFDEWTRLENIQVQLHANFYTNLQKENKDSS